MKQRINRFVSSNWLNIILILFSLTPIVWFKGRGDALINGSDTNFPLNPEIWFLRRFFTWNPIGNAGGDFSSSTAGLFFHFVQYLPYKLGFSLQLVELFSLLFWFSLIVFASYSLSKVIFEKYKISQLIFVSIYVFNVYVFNTWENVKVSNLSLISAIPFGLVLIIYMNKKSISRPKALFFSMIVGIILSGSGINPAYFMCFFAVIAIYMFGVVLSVRTFDFLKFSFLNFLTLAVPILLINAIWIFPTFSFIFGTIAPSGSIDKIGYTNWIDSLSENTSILNIWRQQGAWDWYSLDSTTNQPLYIPYAVNYFFKLPFLIFSFLLPSLSFIALIFWKKEKNYLYIGFGLMMLIGVFLGVGTHLPTGYIFHFLSQHLPFFSLFRSPWYIFTPLLIISVAGLISLLFYSFNSNFKENKYPKIYLYLLSFFGFIIIFGNLVYNYPLVQGKIFRASMHDNFYIHFPSYLFDAAKYIDQNKNGRIINYPDNEIERFSWGYNAIESVLALVVDRETLFLPITAPESPISQLVKMFYSSVKRGELYRADNVLKKLNVSQILEKGDQESLSPVLPEQIVKKKSKSFGSWNIYEYPEGNMDTLKLQVSQLISFAYPYDKAIKTIPLNSENFVLANQNDSVINQVKGIQTKSIIVAKNSQNEDFTNFRNNQSNLVDRLSVRDLSKVIYKFTVNTSGEYSPIIERYNLEKFGIPLNGGISLIVDGKQSQIKILSLNDTYVRLSPLIFGKGDHEIVLNITNDNLVDNNFIKNGEGQFNNLRDLDGDYLSIMNKSKKDVSAKYSIGSFDYMSNYFVSVDYKQIYGNNAAILINQGNTKNLVKAQVERMPNYPEWGAFSFYYEPVQTVSNVKIELLAPLTKDALGTKVLYKNLRFYRVFSNDLYLEQVINKPELLLPDIKFTKTSPVEYEGEVYNVKAPHLIVFSENYSPLWEMVFVGDDKEINETHFTGNLYANVWYVDSAKSNYKFRLYYKRQNLIVLGGVVSLVTAVLFTSVYLLKRKMVIQK